MDKPALYLRLCFYPYLSFIFSKKGKKLTSKWCVAITTGRCQKQGNQVGLQEVACEKGLANFTHQHLQLSNICAHHQVPVPTT